MEDNPIYEDNQVRLLNQGGKQVREEAADLPSWDVRRTLFTQVLRAVQNRTLISQHVRRELKANPVRIFH